MRYATISLTANTIGSIVLFFALRELGQMPQLGIALATTLGGWLNTYLLWSTLRQRGEFVADERLVRNLPLIIFASVAMTVALLISKQWLAPFLERSNGFLIQAAGLGALIAIGLAVYAAIIVLTGVMTRAQLARFTRRRG
jgi:putative peptidoglycan lipid II flippase